MAIPCAAYGPPCQRGLLGMKSKARQVKGRGFPGLTPKAATDVFLYRQRPNVNMTDRTIYRVLATHNAYGRCCMHWRNKGGSNSTSVAWARPDNIVMEKHQQPLRVIAVGAPCDWCYLVVALLENGATGLCNPSR